jgi:hypothetical protein
MDADNRKLQPQEFDRWLDAALLAGANAEPRIGLEERVLGRLRAEPPRKRFAWWPVLTAVTAVFVIAVALVIMHSRPHQRTVADLQRPTASQPSSQSPVVQAGSERADNELDAHRRSRRATRDAACCISTTVIARREPDEDARRFGLQANSIRAGSEQLPRLATFPAPRPESAEEHMLLRLAARRDSFDVANVSTDSMPLKDLSVPEIRIDPMEGTPPDNTPRE